jgi:hypothetical protein
MSVKNMINLCSLNVNGLQNREKRNIINLQYLPNITNIQHLISFLHISIPVNSMRTFPCMYPNIFFNISSTGLDLYLIQTIRPLKVHLCHSIQTGLYLTCG